MLKKSILITLLLSSTYSFAAELRIIGNNAEKLMNVLEVMGSDRIQGRDGWMFKADGIRCIANGLPILSDPGDQCIVTLSKEKQSLLRGAGAMRLFNLLKTTGAPVVPKNEGLVIEIQNVDSLYDAMDADGPAFSTTLKF